MSAVAGLRRLPRAVVRRRLSVGVELVVAVAVCFAGYYGAAGWFRVHEAAWAVGVLHLVGHKATPYVGGYESFVEQRSLARLTQQRQFDQQQRRIAAEQDYIARNIAGQNSKQAKGRRKRPSSPRDPRLKSRLARNTS